MALVVVNLLLLCKIESQIVLYGFMKVQLVFHRGLVCKGGVFHLSEKVC